MWLRSVLAAVALVLAVCVGLAFVGYGRLDAAVDLHGAEYKAREVTPSGQCAALRGIMGAEDGERWGDVVLLSNMDHARLFDLPAEAPRTHSRAHGHTTSDPTSAQGGHIYVLHGLEELSPAHLSRTAAASPDPRGGVEPGALGLALRHAQLRGFPPNTAMHAHGLAVRNDRLYVINHAYSQGGERVDVFSISSEENDADSVPRVVLTFLYTVDFSTCCMGTMNDVVPLSDHRMVVTKYLPDRDPPHGRAHSLSAALRPFADVLGVPWLLGSAPARPTAIYVCDTDGRSAPSEEVCSPLPFRALMWNGVSADADGQHVFAVDVLARTVSVFAAEPHKARTAALRLTRTIHVPFPIDNVVYEAETDTLLGGGMAAMVQCLSWIPAHISAYQQLPRDTFPTGGAVDGKTCPSHVTAIDVLSGAVSVPVLHDGSLLSSASFGLRVGSVYVMGSFTDNGVLLCAP